MPITTSEYEDEDKSTSPKKRERPVIVQFQAAPPSSPSGPRASKRVQWIALAEDGEYAEHKVLARIRYPDTINTEFSSGDFERIRKALRLLVLEHNGWIDPDSDEDEPKTLPPAVGADSDGFWDSLAQEELLLMLKAIGSERKKVLSSLLETPTG